MPRHIREGGGEGGFWQILGQNNSLVKINFNLKEIATKQVLVSMSSMYQSKMFQEVSIKIYPVHVPEN